MISNRYHMCWVCVLMACVMAFGVLANAVTVEQKGSKEVQRICRAIPDGASMEEEACIKAYDNIYQMPNALWNSSVCAENEEFSYGEFTYTRDLSSFNLKLEKDGVACEWHVRANSAD